jgi:hypothetical protein
MVALSPMRQIRDDHNVEWTVYLVERLERPSGKHSAELLPQPYANGWLVFQCNTGKRRLAPHPQDWELLPEATLRSLLAAATPVRRSGKSQLPKDIEQLLRDEELAQGKDS